MTMLRCTHGSNTPHNSFTNQHSHEFVPVVRDLLEDVESADPDVCHHFDSDNGSALLLKNLFPLPIHNDPGTINQLMGFWGRCEQSFSIEFAFHDQIAAMRGSDSELFSFCVRSATSHITPYFHSTSTTTQGYVLKLIIMLMFIGTLYTPRTPMGQHTYPKASLGASHFPLMY
ncbi:hypothetical protein K503DRAFT_210353 [Rhizopogon vinicolor AM-OR11-026]|uniref:Uncharacterized protein n=1 Tax=Rhizopogon vinicolor AM-OR11-026 TaxID=1314800 RepID=A0A1B7NEE8_9AGAM|nr:hypothetical protein K503DRAFT_210353 [Rhizopogon vinicolor AM-OR11-026]